jgi:hypothetical protein
MAAGSIKLDDEALALPRQGRRLSVPQTPQPASNLEATPPATGPPQPDNCGSPSARARHHGNPPAALTLEVLCESVLWLLSPSP